MTLAFGASDGALAGGGYKDPMPAPYSSGRTIWEGFHVGAHVGGGDIDYGVGQTNPASPFATVDDGDDGIIGGIVYGTSWQFGKWVLGTDSAIDFTDSDAGPSTTVAGLAATAEIDWASSSRLRAGVLLNPNLLLYGAVGIAMATVDVSGTLILTGSDDESFFGVTYGGGLEFTSNRRFFARIEYLHTDYGDESFAAVGGGTYDVDLDSDVVRGAIGYRFDWSPFDLLK